MNPKIFIGAFAALVLLMVTLAIHSTLKVSATNEALLALVPAREDLRGKTERMSEKLEMVARALNELEETPTGSTDPEKKIQDGNASLAGNAADKPATAARRLSPHSIVANDPEKMAVYAKNLRDSLDWDYGSMFKAMALTPEQIEKFKDTEVWLEEMRMDLIASIEAQGLTSDSAEYKKLWTDYMNIRGPKKAEVLGPLFEPYAEYFWTQSVRYYPKQLAWAGVFSGETVTSAQVERVADVLIANSKRRGEAPAKHGVEWTTLDWSTASPQLKSLLSPSQLEFLGNAIERDKLQQKVRQRTSQLTAQFKKQSDQ